MVKNKIFYFINVYPKYGYQAQPLFGLIIYLYCGFQISYYRQSYTPKPRYTLLFLQTLIHILQSFSHFLSWSSHSFLSIFSPELSTSTSQSIFLFITRGKWRCYDYFLTRVNRDPNPSFLNGCSIEKGGNGIETNFHL